MQTLFAGSHWGLVSMSHTSACVTDPPIYHFESHTAYMEIS